MQMGSHLASQGQEETPPESSMLAVSSNEATLVQDETKSRCTSSKSSWEEFHMSTGTGTIHILLIDHRGPILTP